MLQNKIRVKIRERAEARGPGANPAFHKRDLNYAKCGLVKMRLVDTGCGYDIVSKREVALMKMPGEGKAYNYFPHGKWPDGDGRCCQCIRERIG